MANFFPIRCFGDVVLFARTHPVKLTNSAAIKFAIDIMMRLLHQQGGIGIAANQCPAIPAPAPSIIIVGVTSQETRELVQTLYSYEEVPDAKVYINPVIVARSAETYYPEEGCLSISCQFLGKVARHKWIVLEYQDREGNKFKEKFNDMTAYIIQHECDHLQGIVFIHRLLNDMDKAQRQEFDTLIDEILAHPTPENLQSKTPLLALGRNKNGRVIINEAMLKKALSTLDRTIIKALKKAVHNSLIESTLPKSHR